MGHSGVRVPHEPASSVHDRHRLATFCHDLRQPLGAALMLLHNAETQAPLHLRPVLEEVEGQLRRLAQLTTAELNETTRRACDVDLVDLVTRCAHDAELAYQVDVIVTASGRPTVAGRADELSRAVGNVLSNACRASAPRQVCVNVVQERSSARVTVQDQGPGFGRIVPQLGLGLEQVRHAVLAHGGSLHVTTSEAGGASVELVLPLSSGARP